MRPAIALGPDGKLYVLDSSGTNGRIRIVDPATLTSTGAIYLTRPATGPIAVSSLGQVFTLLTDSSGALAIDTYESSTGTLLGSTSDVGTFSAEQNSTVTADHPGMLAN